MDTTDPLPHHQRQELTYAGWHAHIAARTPARLVFLTRPRTARMTLSRRSTARNDQLSLAHWLTHISGQRAA